MKARRCIPLADRLAAYSVIDEITGCHNWQGFVSNKGYGHVSLGNGKSGRVHRAAYELAKGPIPPGLQIDHLCRNRRCCNPDHLEAVTPRENVLRGEGHGAVNAQRTHCANGHPYEAADRGNGSRRFCRICRREYMRIYMIADRRKRRAAQTEELR